MHFGFSAAEDTYQHDRNLKHYIRTVEEHVVTCAKARSSFNKEHHHKQAVIWRSEALCYATFFGLADPDIPMVPDLDSEPLAALKKREAKKSAEKAAKSKQEAEERRQKAQSLADIWLQGGAHHYLLNAIPPMLRIKDHEVETSHGVKFPVIHAKRGLKLVRAVMAKGERLDCKRSILSSGLLPHSTYRQRRHSPCRLSRSHLGANRTYCPSKIKTTSLESNAISVKCWPSMGWQHMKLAALTPTRPGQKKRTTGVEPEVEHEA